MAKLKRLGLIALACASLVHAADLFTWEESSGQLKILQDTIQSFQAGDISVIARHISFPLPRHYPLPPVNTPEEFAKRYTDIFDDSLLKIVSSSLAEKDWGNVGSRGYMLQHGIVWADFDGRIFAINHESKMEHELRRKLIEADRSKLHVSLNCFESPVLKWDTKSFRLRIDDLGAHHYRLALWNSGQHPQSKPALSHDSGELEFDGSGGNHHYTFRVNDVTYRCDVVVMGTAEDVSRGGTFNILRGDRELLTEDVLRTY